MADTKITDLTELATQPDITDVLPVVDISDTSMAASGTTKKITRANLLGTVLDGTTASFTTADETKLDGIETGADVTDATNVAAAGGLIDTNNLSDVSNASTARTNLGVAIGTDVLAQQTIGIADNNLLEVDGTPNSAEYARFTANGLEGRTEAEFKADYNLEIGTDVQAYDAVLDATTASFTTADEIKLDGIEAGADVTDEANVTNALDGATLTDLGTPASGDLILLQDASDSNNLKVAQFSTFGGAGSGDAWGDPVDADIIPDADGTRDLGATATRFAETYTDALDVTNNIVVGGTVDGRDVATDGTKLDGIETGADVTDETNVKAALDGATIADITVASGDKVLLQDVSDSDNLRTETAQNIADLYNTAASTTVSGISELATTAEVNTGTDTGRTITPDALAGAYAGTKEATFVSTDYTADLSTGDGKAYIHIPAALNGMNLVTVHAEVITAGTTGTSDFQIHNVTQTADMLSTKITIDSGETGSDTAATPPVIDTANDDVATNDVLRLDIDAVSTTAPKGLIVTMEFRLP